MPFGGSLDQRVIDSHESSFLDGALIIANLVHHKITTSSPGD